MKMQMRDSRTGLTCPLSVYKRIYLHIFIHEYLARQHNIQWWPWRYTTQRPLPGTHTMLDVNVLTGLSVWNASLSLQSFSSPSHFLSLYLCTQPFPPFLDASHQVNPVHKIWSGGVWGQLLRIWGVLPTNRNLRRCILCFFFFFSFKKTHPHALDKGASKTG